MLRIIVIDDDPVIRKIIKYKLEKENYEVLLAEDALEGISRIISEKPDLILLDVVMPEVDGYETLQLIKCNQELKDIPVIMLTGRDEVNDIRKGFDSGADDYLGKPFDFPELLARIKTLLRIKELQKKVLKNERMAAIGQIALTIRHKINNTLTAVVGQSEVLIRREKNLPSHVRDNLEEIYREGAIIQNTIAKLEDIQDFM